MAERADRYFAAILGNELAHDLEDLCAAHHDANPRSVLLMAVIEFITKDVSKNEGIRDSYLFHKGRRHD